MVFQEKSKVFCGERVMSNQEPAVVVKDLYKTFKLPHEQHSGVKQHLLGLLHADRGFETQKVLKGISCKIKKGEFFGIVGRNGSGKSTLLKLLANIYSPDEGLIQVNGSLIPFIELGVGFNPELTGRENVFLNGALLGFDRSQMDNMYDEIVRFAELGKFMDQKLKNYSSGMQVRLAFSIAIKAESDILLLDEVLAVGDEAFQRKCYAYFEDLKRNNKTVILVTHDMGAVERFCDRAMLIEAGEIVEFGEPQIVAHAYTKLFNPVQETKKIEKKDRKRWGTKELQIKNVSVSQVNAGDSRINVDLTIKCSEPLSDKIMIAYTVKSKDRRSLFGESSIAVGSNELAVGDKATYRLSFDNILSLGDYYLDLSLRVDGRDDYIDFWIDAVGLSVATGEVNGLNILANSSLKQVL